MKTTTTNRVRLLGELAASLAHELKQPIAATVINANTSLRWLKHEQPDLDEFRHAAERIVQDGRRAGDIIDRLRSLYRQTPPQRELVDVNEIIREMVVLLQREANRYEIFEGAVDDLGAASRSGRASGEVSGRVGGEAVGSVFTPPFPQPWLGRRHVAVLNS